MGSADKVTEPEDPFALVCLSAQCRLLVPFSVYPFFLHCEKMDVWRERGVNWMSLTVTARESASLLKRKPEKHLISTECICNVVAYFLFCFFSWNFNCIHSLLGSNYTTLFHVFAPVNQNQATTSKLHLLQRSVSAIRSGAAIVGNYSLLLLFLLLMKLFFFFKKLLDYLALLKGAGSSRKGTLIV